MSRLAFILSALSLCATSCHTRMQALHIEAEILQGTTLMGCGWVLVDPAGGTSVWETASATGRKGQLWWCCSAEHAGESPWCRRARWLTPD